ncbi:putative bifunctional diguanylate cyclase/phosphodiesterase [Brytella acorum]|uniref:EAL domain-containing protein n=1 Tax=Brytella acorum TaxID=2959299 RepID=A0AA35V7E1_9PROT|nr:GGDEF domain-containing phosphodiesterase [Brytella acorum]CAI9119260.1 EAL domain-containing protein [Brytella acorum]
MSDASDVETNVLRGEILNATIDDVLIVAITDARGIIRHANTKFCEISGYSADELVGRTHRVIRSGYHCRSFYRAMYAAITSGKIWRGNICNRAKDGSHYWVATTIIPHMDVAGKIDAYIAYRFDITAEIEAGQRMRKLALQDPLLGVLNRIGFSQRLTSVLHRHPTDAKDVALALVDLDGFKELNEQYGHDGGDVVLETIVRRMGEVCGDRGIISRIGGDDFTLLFPFAEPPELMGAMLRRLQAALERPISLSHTDVTVFVSIGYTFTGPECHTEAALMKRVDLALKEAKKHGGHCIIAYSERLGNEVLYRQRMLRNAREGMRDGEFKVYYQPIVDIRSGEVTACEALLRWVHPVRGVLTPCAFWEIFLDFPLTAEVGRLVRDVVVNDLAAWRASGGFSGAVSINLTSADLAEDNFVKAFTDQVAARNLPPDCIVFEVTESMLLTGARAERTRQDLLALTAAGFAIVFDDFGTGYASLGQLRELPLQSIKIDRSFIANIATNERDRQIVAGITDLAHRLSIRVVAEGIENEEQCRILNEIGVDALQGFLLACPVNTHMLSLAVASARETLLKIADWPLTERPSRMPPVTVGVGSASRPG